MVTLSDGINFYANKQDLTESSSKIIWCALFMLGAVEI
jgi:hypothetical protein